MKKRDRNLSKSGLQTTQTVYIHDPDKFKFDYLQRKDSNPFQIASKLLQLRDNQTGSKLRNIKRMAIQALCTPTFQSGHLFIEQIFPDLNHFIVDNSIRGWSPWWEPKSMQEVEKIRDGKNGRLARYPINSRSKADMLPSNLPT